VVWLVFDYVLYCSGGGKGEGGGWVGVVGGGGGK